jgi:autoinducer 2-degrading protein
MRKTMFTAAVLATLFVSGTEFSTSAESPGPYINLVELVIVPSELPKFLELAKENAATTIMDPGVREFNIMQLASNPNHLVIYEVYENEAALMTHRAADHFKKYLAATASMVADRNVRPMAAVDLHSNAH